MNYTKLDEIRFWSKVNITGQKNGCWYWGGSKHNFGYGWFRINKKTYLSHRLSLIFYNNGIEEFGKEVIHSCDNPSCCNPFHLRWGDQKENIGDAVKRGRSSLPPLHFGEDQHSSKLKWSDVDEIRLMRSNGVSVKKMSKKYGVSENTIYRLLNFKTWAIDPRKEGP